jgi:hypothetical protein
MLPCASISRGIPTEIDLFVLIGSIIALVYIVIKMAANLGEWPPSISVRMVSASYEEDTQSTEVPLDTLEEILNQYEYEAYILCKYVNGIPDIIENTLCLLICLTDSFIIELISNPPVKAVLQYENIHSFRQSVISKTITAPVQSSDNKEKLLTVISIQYTAQNMILSELQFILDVAQEDDFYNDFKTSDNDIFAYVNARILKQDTTIIL